MTFQSTEDSGTYQSMITELQNQELYISAILNWKQNFTTIAKDQLEDPLQLPKMLPQLTLDVFNADKIQASLEAMATELGIKGGTEITPMVSCRFSRLI